MQRLCANAPVGTAPAEIDTDFGSPVEMAKAKMEVRGAFTGMPRPAVYLSNQAPAVGQMYSRSGANRGTRWPVSSTIRMPSVDNGPLSRGASHRQAQVKPEEGSGVRGSVLKDERLLPLVSHSEIQAAIAVYVGGGDPSATHGLGQAQSLGDVVVASVRGAHKKRVVVGAAYVIPGAKRLPGSWVRRKCLVDKRQLL